MRDGSTYRGNRKAARAKGMAADLKVERQARGITRQQLDRELGEKAKQAHAILATKAKASAQT